MLNASTIYIYIYICVSRYASTSPLPENVRNATWPGKAGRDAGGARRDPDPESSVVAVVKRTFFKKYRLSINKSMLLPSGEGWARVGRGGVSFIFNYFVNKK